MLAHSPPPYLLLLFLSPVPALHTLTQVAGNFPSPTPTSGVGESRSVFQSLLTPSTRWGMSLSAPPPPRPTRALPRPPSPPPRETRARRASASLSRMLTHLRPTSALALARPARDAHPPPPQERTPCVTTYGPGPAGPTPALLYPRADQEDIPHGLAVV